MNEQNNHMEIGCVCHENHEETVAQSCAGHHHGPAPEDTSGPRLLFTLALNLVIPTAQVIGGLLAGRRFWRIEQIVKTVDVTEKH